ncbi:DUF1826 domain-containing protein [Pseudophaeobacter sp.]|uniref:DUF1826 domain-containing protein n=1 Tax=Pseudophaeobacter sp. TaxID=1971739 RepID=UPI00405801C6
MQDTLLRSPLQNVPAGVSVTELAEDLSVIHRHDCSAAIWNRTPLSTFQAWIDALDPGQLPKARLILRPGAVDQTLTHIFDSAEILRCPERDRLSMDISALVELFSGIMSTRYIRLRLDVVRTNACRKFHIDAVQARLVCTYRGTGTQLGIQRENGEPQCLLTVPTGAPVMLRGTKWPEYPRSNLLHRSPPIEGTGETRFVVVIDPVNDPDLEI